MRRNKLMTLVLAVICGISVMTTSVKAETTYYETEDGVIVYEEDEVIVTEQLKEEPQSRAENTEKLATPVNLRIDTTSSYATMLVWDRMDGVLRYDAEVYQNGNKIDGGITTYKYYLNGLEGFGSGKYIIKIRARGEDAAFNSDWASIEFEYKTPDVKLNMPTDIRWDENQFGTIMWNPVEGASGYEVSLYQDEKRIICAYGSFSNCEFDCLRNISEEGNYTVEVKALSKDINTISSSVAGTSNTLNYKDKAPRLSEPRNIRLSDCILQWDEVLNASYYHVMICLNGVELGGTTSTKAMFNMEYYFKNYGEGTYTFKIMAVSSDITQYANSGYAISPEYVIGEQTPEYTEEQKEHVRNFVKRLYQIILNREAEVDGLNAWTQQLLDRKTTGAQLVASFVESDEFTQRGLTNEEVVEIMYQAMLGRTSDEGGKAGWSKILNSGCSYMNIVNGFSGSAEFNEICGSYGITAGTVELNKQRDKNPQLTEFVSRCYTQALGRQYETNGLEAWCDAIISGRNTPKEAAQMFIFSDEFIQKNLNNEEYVKVLYRTFMGREADEGGLAAWVKVLESGREDRMKVLEGFSDSVEFDGILQSFGLR